MSDVLLSVRHLTACFFLHEGVLKAVDDVSFDVGRISERDISLTELPQEPASGQTPVPEHGILRDLQNLSRLQYAQAAEET